jgi:hypothetical protein
MNSAYNEASNFLFLPIDIPVYIVTSLLNP